MMNCGSFQYEIKSYWYTNSHYKDMTVSSHNHLIFIIGIPISRDALYVEMRIAPHIIGIQIPIIKIWYVTSHNHLIFIIGIPIHGKAILILKWGPGANFMNNFSIGIQIRRKICFSITPLFWIWIWIWIWIERYYITTKFCTCLNSTAVMPCAKFHSDNFITPWMRGERNWHQIWITMEILLVEWASHPILLVPCTDDNVLSRDQSRYVPSQWETSLQCNDVSHWLGSCLDWSLLRMQSIKVSCGNHFCFLWEYKGCQLVQIEILARQSDWSTSL